MTLSRRRVLQASAVGPLLAFLPRIPASAAATGPTTAVPVPTGGTLVANEVDVLGIALSWDGPDLAGTVAEVRAKVDGVWQPAIGVEPDHGHGAPDPTGRIHGPAVLVPGATAFRITPTRSVPGLRHMTIADSRGPLGAMATPPAALATVEPIPGLVIIERHNWTDRGRLDTIDCWLGSSVDGLGCRADVGIRHAVVHHTVNINNYGPDDVPTLLRGIQSYHMDTRGWDDIGYNFVIDRFGRIWHARAGTISGSVSGAHTSGLNAESVGVAVLGTFGGVDPGQPVVDALSILLGWKLGRYGVDPMGTTEVRSVGGDYAEPDEVVLINNISGHRENQRTSCPGSILFGRIPEIRAAAIGHVPVFGHLVPTYRPASVDFEGWAIDRLAPTAPTTLKVMVDGAPPQLVTADASSAGLSDRYPDAGDLHGFAYSVPIDLDTRSIVASVESGGVTATLLDLRLFATFIDVEPTRYFAEGIYWLRANELSVGTQPGLFEPMDEVTRLQMAAFLWRLFGRIEPTIALPFTDVPSDHILAPAVAWLAETGITRGTSAGTFSPDRFVTRGEMAAFIWRMCGQQAPQQSSPFTDVPPSSFYAVAANWMQQTGITHGTTATTYSPDDFITRGQMATFLHRLARSNEAWATVEPPPVVAATLASV